MSIQTVGVVNVTQGILFSRNNEAIDGGGLLTLDWTEDQGSIIVIPNGVTLKGISLVEGSSPVFVAEDQELMIIVRSDGVATLAHESGDVAAEQRLHCSGGVDVFVDNRRIQIFFSFEGGAWRWRVPDWS